MSSPSGRGDLLLPRFELLLAGGTARFELLLACGTARFELLLAGGTARFDPSDPSDNGLPR